ncbi:MAG: molybdopterin molybdotransferase MoeA [Eubacterium sp.]|nr:molybdopterin molybdotransferase MoeA [Eubacterium sp.]
METGLTVEEGRDRILALSEAKGTEYVETEFANGRILSEDIYAQENIPPFDRSPLDGYALRARDIKGASGETPVTLKVIEEVPAGSVPTKEVTEMAAVKILTGAPIPKGADLVVKYEETEFTETEVTFFKPGKSGGNIVPAGEDIRAGQLVLSKGERITPAVCGIIAGLGRPKVQVYQKPVVAFLSTGSELISVGEPLSPGKIRNSSVYTLKSYLEDVGAETILLGNVVDDPEEISEKIRSSVDGADMIVTTGGVSVGDYDFLIRVMEQIGAEILFWKEKLKPGGAFLASVYKGKPVISLSGNPSAAAVAMILNVVPAVRKMCGNREFLLKEATAKLAEDYTKSSPNMRIVPGKLEIREGQAVAVLSGHSGNGMLHPLHGCNILGRIEAGSKGMKKGNSISVYYI